MQHHAAGPCGPLLLAAGSLADASGTAATAAIAAMLKNRSAMETSRRPKLKRRNTFAGSARFAAIKKSVFRSGNRTKFREQNKQAGVGRSVQPSGCAEVSMAVGKGKATTEKPTRGAKEV